MIKVQIYQLVCFVSFGTVDNSSDLHLIMDSEIWCSLRRYTNVLKLKDKKTYVLVGVTKQVLISKYVINIFIMW